MDKQERERNLICQFTKKNGKKCGNKVTLQHFLAEGTSRRSRYNAIKLVNDGIGAGRRKGTACMDRILEEWTC